MLVPQASPAHPSPVELAGEEFVEPDARGSQRALLQTRLLPRAYRRLHRGSTFRRPRDCPAPEAPRARRKASYPPQE